MIEARHPRRGTTGIAETPEPYRTTEATARQEAAEVAEAAGATPFPEATLTSLWLLGRVPAPVLQAALPAPLLRVWRVGRAGRGPGPDVREAAFLAASGATIAGDVEVHLRASDFVRHGHAEDPAYAGVVLHLCWADDREAPGTPTPLPGGGAAPTVALSAWLSAREVERLVALGPDLEVAAPPCAGQATEAKSIPTDNAVGDSAPADRTGSIVRDEGRKRLAERTWRAWRLADRYGFDGALTLLLERAVASSAGRVRESEARRAAIVAGILDALGRDPVEALARHATGSDERHGARGTLVAAMRAGGLGEARASEVAWNVALPLVAALAAAYDDVALARATAELADAWPAPRPYGRTRALAAALTPTRDVTRDTARDAIPEPMVEPAAEPTRRSRAGAARRESSSTARHAPARTALYAQGLLHLQDLWCSRGGCGVCPLSADGEASRP